MSTLDTINNNAKIADQKLFDDVTNSDMQKLIANRSAKRSQATKAVNKIDTQLDNLSEPDLKHYHAKLNELYQILTELDNDINSFLLTEQIWDMNKFQDESDRCDIYLDYIGKAIQKLTIKLDELTKTNTSQINSASSNFQATPTSSHKVPLPYIDLPKFDGNAASYSRFIHSFESLIAKYNLEPIEKYSYLLKQVSGPARKLIESVALSDLNYDDAKQLLDDAYCDKLTQQSSVIQQFIDLKMGPEPADALVWISNARILTQQLSKLNIESEDFARFFLWRSMQSSFKRELIAVSNETKPSLQTVQDSLFKANSRYQESAKLSSKETIDNNKKPLGTQKIPKQNYAFAADVQQISDTAPAMVQQQNST